MAGSNIPDIASDPEKGILKVTFSLCSYMCFPEDHERLCPFIEWGSILGIASREVSGGLG